MEAEQSPRGTADLEELLGADQRPLAATDTANTPIGGGQAAGDGGSPAEVEQRVEVLREEFLGSLHRSADAASDEGGGATAAAAPDGGEPATQLQATEDVDEESEVDFEEEVDDEFEDAAEVEDAEREAAEAAAEGSTAAQQAAPSGSAPAAWEGPSTSRAALQLHPLEALDEEPDPLSDAIDAVLAAHEAKASTSGTAGGKGRSGGAASLLSGLLSRVHGGVQAGKQLVGQHIKMGERSGVGGAERNRRMQQTAQAPRREKKTSVRRLKRKEEQVAEKKQAREQREKAKKELDRKEAELASMCTKANMEAFGETLHRFAQACSKGDRGQIHLLFHNIFGDINQVIEIRQGLHPRGVALLPWKATKYPDFFQACYALIIRATGSVELVDEIEKMLRDEGKREEYTFMRLVADTTMEEELRKRKKVPPEVLAAKRALVHEWIQQGSLPVLQKVLRLKPDCIAVPEEPPLVTALRAGHGREVISLLVEPVVKHREGRRQDAAVEGLLDDRTTRWGGVDEASPSDSATPLMLAIQKDRPDVLREILKHSSRWSLTVEGKPWTPLCYALAQKRPSMVGLLLAHAKRQAEQRRQTQPDSPDLAQYVNTRCEGTTALYRAVAADVSDMARLLLESGADPALRLRDNGRYTSSLHLAAHHEHQQPLLELMLAAIPAERRAAVLNSLTDGASRSLLHIAVQRRHEPLARLLLGMGARPTSQSEGRSPLLLLLLEQGKLEQAQQAQQPGGEEGGEEAEEETAAGDPATQLQRIEAAFLQHWQLHDTARALHPDQKANHPALLREWLLRQRGTTLDPLLADAARRQELGQTAVNERNTPLLELLLEQPAFSAAGLHLHRLLVPRDRTKGAPVDLVAALLDKGARVDEREPESGAPLLHKAAEENDLPCLELLLARGADVAAVDDAGNNVLHAVAGQKEKGGVLYTAVVNRVYEVAPQLVTRRNREFYLPSDRAPAGSAVETQLESLARRQTDAAKVAEEAERWERAAKDLSLLGPPNEDGERKRARIGAMLGPKLKSAVQAIQRADSLGLLSGSEVAGPAGAAPAAAKRAMRSGRDSAEPQGPATPAASSFFRQRPRKRSWADLADEIPPVVRMPVWPEVLEAAAAAARADPVAAVAEILRRARPEGLDAISSLDELPWQMDIHKDAWAEWMGMEARHRHTLLTLLLRIASGRFVDDPELFRRVATRREGSAAGGDNGLADVEVYLVRLPRSMCLAFEVAPEVDVRRSVRERPGGAGRYVEPQYHEIIRIWFAALDPSDERVKDALDMLAASYRKGASARHQLLLQDMPLRSTSRLAQAGRLPLDFNSKQVTRAAAAQAAAEAAKAAGQGGGRVRRYFPPASTDADSYTVLKFHPLEDSMVHAVMTNEGQTDVDFKFRLSPEETEIIERQPHPPQSLILLGRSGTGKTTCAVFRMFDHWRAAFEAGEPLHQVFVTVSATLKEQVAKAFVRLRNGLPAVTPDRAAAYAAAAAQPYHSFRGLPEEAWPLFLSAKQYLHMLDGTLREPFFKRRRDGSFYFESEAMDDDDGMSMLVDLAGAAAAAGTAGPANGNASAAEQGARVKVTYSYFASSMFRRCLRSLPPEDLRKVDFNAGLAWQEIVSYIKGTRQAVEGDGCLTEEQYLSDIGRKQAPNFGPDSRRLIYQVFCAYEAAKQQVKVEGRVAHFMYDAADLVAHMHRQLAQGGYRGEPIHELYCDEVQDFTQAELLLGLRVVSDPNGLFFCGDTCQTIARGIGFRFTDVKQLFYEAQREAAERKGRSGGVQMPDIVELQTNYRTHSGVLDVAASVVALLKRFFSEHIDALEPEQAFLEAPHLPLLLPAATPGNVAMLLSGGDDAEAWKTEFGASQVVLRRTLASPVPHFLAKIDAVIMTIPQSKGLEFNDVFILDFFAQSPCKDEWRLLLTYLAEVEALEKKEGAQRLPFEKPLVDVSPAELGLSGARLDALPFDESQHKLLCEELKHLYTAVTRAKNAVVFFDSDPHAHAPFYYLLARLGLARVVAGALQLEEGKDLHQLGLSKAKSTPQDWIRHAQTMVRTRNYEAAATCFRKAGNLSRAQACTAQAKLEAAAQLEAEASGQQVEAHQRVLRFDAGYSLLGTAVNAPPQEADAAERREWLLLAAAALKAAGEELAAQQITAALGPLASRGPPTAASKSGARR